MTIELEKLVEQFSVSNLTELHYETKEVKIALSKNQTPLAVSPAEITHLPEKITEETPSLNEVTEQKVEEKKISGKILTAPLIGTIYLKPEPDANNFVTVGQHVEKGETVAIIEAMKVMNDIPSPVSGIVTEILVENQTVVEYDRPLFAIAED